MPVNLKILMKDWAKVDAKKAKTAADPITEFVASFSSAVKGYDRARFVDGVSGDNPKIDTDRFIASFDSYSTRVAGLEKNPKLTAKEKTFLADTAKALKAEFDFWSTRPIERNLPIEIEKDLRKSWALRKKEAEETFSKWPGNKGKRFPVKFDEGFGPALDKLEKPGKLRDQKALAAKLDKIVTSYAQAINTNKVELGDVPYDLLMKQLTRINDAVKRILADKGGG